MIFALFFTVQFSFVCEFRNLLMCNIFFLSFSNENYARIATKYAPNFKHFSFKNKLANGVTTVVRFRVENGKW